MSPAPSAGLIVKLPDSSSAGPKSLNLGCIRSLSEHATCSTAMLVLAMAIRISGCTTGSPAQQLLCAVQDGTSKMSKSAESDLSRINLLDDPMTIQDKLKRCKTDSYEGLEFGNPERPEATNLITIYSLCTGVTVVSGPELSEAAADDKSRSAAGCYGRHGQTLSGGQALRKALRQ